MMSFYLPIKIMIQNEVEEVMARRNVNKHAPSKKAFTFVGMTRTLEKRRFPTRSSLIDDINPTQYRNQLWILIIRC